MRFMIVRGLAILAAMAFSATAQAGVIDVLATGSTSGSGGYVWSTSQAGGRLAYSAAIAECPTPPNNCGASAQAIAYNEYEARFNPNQAYLDIYGQGGGVLVNMSYFLSATGQATASIQWGSNRLSVGPSFSGISQTSNTAQILMVFDGAAGNYVTIIKLSANANASANGVIAPGPMVSVGLADPHFTPIDPAGYSGSWSFNEILNPLTVDEFGTRDPNIDVPIDPSQVPVPAGLVLMGTGVAALTLARGRKSKRRK